MQAVNNILRRSNGVINAARRGFASQDHFYRVLQMDETRTDLREMIANFAEEEVKPLAEEMDQTMVFPHHMW